MPTEERDIDAAYEDAIHVLSTKPPKAESKPDPQTEQEDYYRTFRTKCVLPETCLLHAATNSSMLVCVRCQTLFSSTLHLDADYPPVSS